MTELSLAGFGQVSSIDLLEETVVIRNPLSLRGVEYVVTWETLVILKVSKQPRLTKLPPLPPNLEVFRCSLTGLKELPALPDSLRQLKARDLKITSVGKLPSNLEVLDLTNSNRILGLPKLPSSLKILRVSHLDLRWLGRLPPRLEKLEASGCQLSQLPKLPATLVELHVSDNNLDSLPRLSDLVDLEILNVSENFLTELLPLPPKVKTLYCGRNLLRSLPPLPARIETVAASNNRLTSLPPSKSLVYLHVESNPLLELPFYPSLHSLHAKPKLLVAVGGLYRDSDSFFARGRTYQCPVVPGSVEYRGSYARVLVELMSTPSK